MKRIAVALLLALATPAWGFVTDTLVVQQPLPSGVTTSVLSNEMVTGGFPLLQSDAIPADTLTSLAITGVTDAQFKTLMEYPDGKAKWVGVTFKAPAAGLYEVTNTGTASAAPSIAYEVGDTIVVNTGTALFRVKKKSFNLLDYVQTSLGTYVPKHLFGGVVVKNGATIYASSYDDSSTTVLEENGPVTAVVKATGTLETSGHAEGMDYMVRLYFYKGKSYVKAAVTLRNARHTGSFTTKTFDSAWVEIPTLLGTTRTVSFGAMADSARTFSYPVASNASACLYNAKNVWRYAGETDGVASDLTTDLGLRVCMDGTVPNSLGDVNDYGKGWVSIKGVSKAIRAGMQDMAAYFPSGFEVANDTLKVAMFSPRNTKTGLKFSWGAHETREMLFDFGASTDSDLKFAARVQYPQIAVPTFTTLRDKGGLRGETRLITIPEQCALYEAIGQTFPPSGFTYTDASIKFRRVYNYASTGGPNQFDQEESHLLDFLRGAGGGRWEQARMNSQWKADQAVVHTDDFDYGRKYVWQSGPAIPVDNAAINGKGTNSTFDSEHPHWLSIRDLYLLTGDKRLDEASNEYFEMAYYFNNNPLYGALFGSPPFIAHVGADTTHGYTSQRRWARAFRDMAMGAEHADTTATYFSRLRNMAYSLRDARFVAIPDSTYGWNMDRGFNYTIDGYMHRLSKPVTLFMFGEMLGGAIYEAMRVFKEIGDYGTGATAAAADSLYEDMRDRLLGTALFIGGEALVKPTNPGYPYYYDTGIVPDSTGRRGDQMGYVLAHGYEMTADSLFAYQCRDLAPNVGLYQHWLRHSELPQHARLWTWLNRQSFGVLAGGNEDNFAGVASENFFDVDVDFVTADSTARIVIVPPPGATEYAIRYYPDDTFNIHVGYLTNPITRKGWPLGTSYAVTSTAIDSVGDGIWNSTNIVFPAALPVRQRIVPAAGIADTVFTPFLGNADTPRVMVIAKTGAGASIVVPSRPPVGRPPIKRPERVTELEP